MDFLLFIESILKLFERFMFIYFLKFIYVHYFYSFIKITLFGTKILDHFVLKKMEKKSNSYEVALNLKLLTRLDYFLVIILQTINSLSVVYVVH